MPTHRTFQKCPQSPRSHSLVKSPASLSYVAYKETFLLLPLQHPYKVQHLIKGMQTSERTWRKLHPTQASDIVPH